jgi:hypothetical protein
MTDEPKDNVINFNGVTYGDVPVNQVLDGAKDRELDTVIVIGKRKVGDELDYYFACSEGTNQDLLWDIEQFKHFLFNG